jgi:hypothetical protein
MGEHEAEARTRSQNLQSGRVQNLGSYESTEVKTKTPKTPKAKTALALLSAPHLSPSNRHFVSESKPKWLRWFLETLIRSASFHSPHKSTAAAEDRLPLTPQFPNLFLLHMTEPRLLLGGDPWPPSRESMFSLYLILFLLLLLFSLLFQIVV